MVAAKNAGRAGSLLLGMALLALSGSQWVSPARADEPAKELSAEEHDRLLKEAADLDGRAGRLIQKGDRAAAVDLLQQLLAVRRGLYLADKSPEAQRELARVLNNLGMMQESVGKYADAADSLQKALDTYRDLYPRDKYPDGHAVVAHALNNLGGLYWSTGEYAKAESYFRDALDMLRKLHTDGKLFAVTLNNLGTVLRAQGKYDEAADCYEQALEFFRKASPRDLFPIAHGLANLADLMQEVRKYDKAGDYYLQSLEMLRQIYPVESHPDGRPDLVLRLNDLGLLMQEQGKYDEAEGYQREALEMVQALPRGAVSGGQPRTGRHAQLHGGAAERAREIRGGGGAPVREPDHARPHRAGLRGRGRRSRSAQFHRVAHAQPRLLPHGRRAPAGRRRPRSLPRALARQDDVGPQSASAGGGSSPPCPATRPTRPASFSPPARTSPAPF